MTLKEFHPEGSTGEDDGDMFYRLYVTGPQGAHYELWKEIHQRKEDLNRAEAYLRRNFDVVSIKVINETK